MALSIKELRAESYSDIGSLIEGSADLILDEWCRRALEEQPKAKRVNTPALRDHLGNLLRSIGQALRDTTNASRPRTAAVQHGEQRWQTGWSLTEMVRDYQLLRVVIIECLEQVLTRPLFSREAIAIGVFLDDAISVSVAEYVANHEDEALRNERQRAELLKETSRRKDEFLAVLAHELRNPLSPISASTQILRLALETADEPVKHSIDTIERQAAQISRLVEDMLDLARIGQGRFELRKVRVNLRDVLEQAVSGVQSQMHARGHHLVVSIPAETIQLQADPDRLLQIISNLLTNAVKYSEPGGEILLSAERSEDEAIIRVRDRGLGIPTDMLSHVFDLFAQVRGSESYAQGGLGIGLTLVRRLVEQHGGTVTCSSAGQGHGSEFVVQLPLMRA
jgi:signal transduction histidine kinase